MFAEKQLTQLSGPVSAKPLPLLCSITKQSHMFVTSSLSSSQPVSFCLHSTEPKPHTDVSIHDKNALSAWLSPTQFHHLWLCTAQKQMRLLCPVTSVWLNSGIYGKSSIFSLAQRHNERFIFPRTSSFTQDVPQKSGRMKIRQYSSKFQEPCCSESPSQAIHYQSSHSSCCKRSCKSPSLSLQLISSAMDLWDSERTGQQELALLSQ